MAASEPIVQKKEFVQYFLIHRHGDRYSLNEISYGPLWPQDDKFNQEHIGKLSPNGVIRMVELGKEFKKEFDVPLVSWSTCQSRALESAWSFSLGYNPGIPVKLHSEKCPEVPLEKDSLIRYYSRESDDPLFGRYKSRWGKNYQAYQCISLRQDFQSTRGRRIIEYLQEIKLLPEEPSYQQTVDIIKQLYSQILVDEQLYPSEHFNLIKEYQLTDDEVDWIIEVGIKILSCRFLDFDRRQFVADVAPLSVGIITYLRDKILKISSSKFYELSCHDSNIMAFASILNLIIDPPLFSGYILLIRTKKKDSDTVSFYYCKQPGQPRKLLFWPIHKELYHLEDCIEKKFDTSYFVMVLEDLMERYA